MATNTTHESQMPSKVRIGARLMALAGLAQIISGIQFLFANFSEAFLERGITLAEVGVSKSEIGAFNLDLLEYISHLHIIVAGFAMALGFVFVVLAWFGVQRGFPWAWWAIVGALVIAAGVGIPPHFFYGLATVGHLGPTFVVLTTFAIGAIMSYPSVHPRKDQTA